MPRYFEKISIENFKNRIEVLKKDSFIRGLLKYVGKDIKVKFDLENTSDEEGFGPKGMIGYNQLENGLTFYGCVAGGDGERSVYFIFYWDGKNIRGYVPTEGNPWNTTTRMAYGNDSRADLKNAKKRYPSYFDDDEDDYNEEDEFDGHDFDFDFEPSLIKKDILERIKLRG